MQQLQEPNYPYAISYGTLAAVCIAVTSVRAQNRAQTVHYSDLKL